MREIFLICSRQVAPVSFLILFLVLAPGASAQFCTAPPPGLVSWWPGDGNANDIVDGNNGTLQNGAAFGVGNVGQAFSFAKGTAAVLVPHNANLNFADFTIESWINLQNPLAGGEDAIVTKWDNQLSRSDASHSGYQLFLEPDTHQLKLTLDNFDQHLLTVGSVPVGVWTHVTVTRQGNQVTFYINSVQDSSFVTTAPVVTNTDPLVIGGFYDTSLNPPYQPNANFGGLIDELSAYNRALSASEIQAIFNAGTAGKCKQADTVGPITSNVVVSPDPVAVNTNSTLNATVDDSTTGGSNIASAYYSISGGAPSQMQLTPSSAIATQASANLGPFSQSNVYNVCVHGTDSAGNTGADACVLLPVYDPNGSFVTGGGEVASPSGADLLNSSAAGQATFGFVSKYLPGRNTPSGNLEFQFKQGNLDFKSTSMDWLVVTGEPRAKFHGTGTINGTNVCNFEVDAWDASFSGNADAFGLNITSCSNGGDRYMLPATPLTKGSIIIHK